MKHTLSLDESASTLLCAMGTILIISLVGANVLINCTARYNGMSKQVKGWKESLYAAEAGGDIAFNEVRKVILGGGTPFSGTGWTTVDATHWTYTLPTTIGDSGNLSVKIAVDNFSTTNAGDGVFRIRSVGTATVFGLPRTGMKDGSTGLATNFAANGVRGDGDSLIRKIDFQYDHFLATYGNGDGNGKTIQAVSHPQVSRRIELIAVPVMPINGAIKALVGYNGNGADSYDSKNGPYPGSSNPVGNSPITGLPYIADAHNGNVAINDNTFNVGYVWGDLTTNGGNATQANASGVVDNNVPINIPPYKLPTFPNPITTASGNSLTPAAAGSWAAAPVYQYNSSASNLTINNPSGTSETYVDVIVNGNVTNSLTVAQGVNVRLYFTGNFSMKARDVNNNNVDGAVASNPSRAGHLQLYGISPTDGSTQSINIGPPGSMYAAIYAPSANFSVNGNPVLYGAIVCASWSGNGATYFHFDKELAQKVSGIDYRLASYVEDVR